MDARIEKEMTEKEMNMKSWISSHVNELENVDDLSFKSLAAVKRAIEMAQVERYVKTLTPITDFSKVEKGDKIFHKSSLSVEYVDTFDHFEVRRGNVIVYYRNDAGESWDGEDKGWFYAK